jgi:hypothetical protein
VVREQVRRWRERTFRREADTSAYDHARPRAVRPHLRPWMGLLVFVFVPSVAAVFWRCRRAVIPFGEAQTVTHDGITVTKFDFSRNFLPRKELLLRQMSQDARILPDDE